jgi:hypothetical protein
MGHVTISGASDDLIEVEGDIREEFYEKNASNDGDILAFSDGTVLRIAFDPDGSGNWRITPLARGAAELTITQTVEEDDTDRADLEGDLAWVVHGIGWAKR